MSDEFEENIFPIAYLITVRCYGTWLHGDARSSVDRHGGNCYGSPRRPANANLEQVMKETALQQAVILNEPQREVVSHAILEVCQHHGYLLRAVNVRTNHFHAVISAQIKPEIIADTLKRYATRRLRDAGLIEASVKPWARGRSRRYLWKPQHVNLAIDYVLYGQGDNLPEFG